MKLFLFILFIVGSFFVRADAWDNMTAHQAELVVKFLHRNPYIIDYCDCCGGSDAAYLIKVESSEVVECAWDKKQFSVLIKGVRITQFEVTNGGIDDYHTNLVNQDVEYTIYMNYTFGFDHHMKWAVPLFKLIDYSKIGPICYGATNYPDPSDPGVQISNEAYKTWYDKHIK